MGKVQNYVDVLVIGAGASGGAFSWSLSKAGINVMCLDQGGWVDPSSYPSTLDDWEIHRQTNMNTDPNVRALPEDYPINDSASPISPLMYNAVGGSTIHWGAHFPRFHPSDFKVKTLDGVSDDWPLDYKRLEPFYDLNDSITGVSGYDGDPAYPPKSPRQTPPVPLGRLGDTVAKGFNKLGWHWWPSDSAIISQPFKGRQACNNCGPCDQGCAIGAKASTDITHWPEAIASGAILKTHARVREVTIGKDGLANGVIYYDEQKKIQHQKARFVIIACNGIGTPRLLLNSVSPLFPDGLTNSSGYVGENLMFHPYAMVTGVFDNNLESNKGPNGCSILSHEFYETDLSRGFIRGYSFQVLRGSGPLNTALGGLGRYPVPWGKMHRRVFHERFGRTMTISVCGEDLPERHNRVTLDPILVDGDGIPAPKVSYTMSSNSLKMMNHGTNRAKEVLEAAGAKEVLTQPLLRPSGWHLLGTTRMGLDSRDSVVNQWGQSHDVKNLFIIDGSIFITAGAVNPTSTIQALALYIADYFKRQARHLLE